MWIFFSYSFFSTDLIDLQVETGIQQMLGEIGLEQDSKGEETT